MANKKKSLIKKRGGMQICGSRPQEEYHALKNDPNKTQKKPLDTNNTQNPLIRALSSSQEEGLQESEITTRSEFDHVERLTVNLYEAIQTGNLSQVQTLLDEGAEPAQSIDRPESYNQKRKVYESASGYAETCYNNTPRSHQTKANRKEIKQLLEDQSGQSRSERTTTGARNSLDRYVRQSEFEKLKNKLKSGKKRKFYHTNETNLQYTQDEKNIALFSAVERGRNRYVIELLKNGAQVQEGMLTMAKLRGLKSTEFILRNHEKFS